MAITVVACETIEDELKQVMNGLGLNYPVIWLEGGLHNRPENLRAKLQEVLGGIGEDCEKLLLAMGHCGGGVNNLITGRYTTVVPVADDCLSLLLGSMAARKCPECVSSYFLTSGWMRHENNVITSYHQSLERYGEAKTARIHKMMLGNYQRFALVDTGAYDLEQARERVLPVAEKIGLKVEAMAGSSEWLKDLLTGPYDDPARFIVLPPESEIKFDHWSALLEGGY